MGFACVDTVADMITILQPLQLAKPMTTVAVTILISYIAPNNEY